MITTNNETLYNKLLQLRSHGMVYQGNEKLIDNHGGWYMEMQSLGYNYRLPDILCALGASQLDRAEEGVDIRRSIAAKYDQAFRGTKIKIHTPKEGIGHAYHLYVIEVENKNLKNVEKTLKKNNIFYENIGFTQKNFFEIEGEMRIEVKELFKINNEWYNNY